MHRARRTWMLLPVAVALLTLAPHLDAAEPECRCVKGNGCYHFLNAPVKPPDDPCGCPKCRALRGSCPKKWPADWNRNCGSGVALECFLRRHAASWKIACSEHLRGRCACKTPHPELCPSCGKDGPARNQEDLDLIARQLEIERRIFGRKRKIVVLRSPHFYLVTDIPEMRIVAQGGGSRRLRMHELAHVYVQRAELAYEDFVRHLGDRMTLERPSAIFLLESESTKRRIAQAYLGHFEPELLYGADAKSISGGYGYNGLAISTEKHATDDQLHFQMRHLVGHLLASCWVTGGGATKILPKWMYVGAAHWLSRLPKKFEGRASFCSGEGLAVSGSGKNWDLKVRKSASRPRATPIQRIFDAKGLDDLDIDAHMRAWSWFRLFLAEDRERFLAFMAAIREGVDQRLALKNAFGIEAEEFERRWRDRVLGRRPTLAPTPKELDAGDPESAGARERGLIRTETDADTLASRIRALRSVEDARTAATVVARLDMTSDLVRETIVLVLSRTKSPEVRAWLRTKGVEDHEGMTRAQIVRVIGNLRDAEAAEAVAAHTEDAHWLVRAHVARTLGVLGRDIDLPILTNLVADRSRKTRIAAMDALAELGARAAPSWRPVAENLGARAWQVRSAAAECLGALAARGSVDALIDRMAKEAGRIRQDIRAALKLITKDDLGNDPRHWRDWWDEEKKRAQPGGGGKDSADAGRYAEDVPVYYGLRVFSQAVGYVLDTSSSMGFSVKLDPAWLKKHKRAYGARGTKIHLACQEIGASLRTLDPRTRFNLYFFKSRARAWKSELIPATPANTGRAVSAAGNQTPTDALTAGGGYRTNYVDVFRLVLSSRKNDVSGHFADTPDTIYFMTDGKPTVGDITDTDTLLAWYGELNRFARIRTHVITFGRLEMNPEFLRRLAEENGGRFIQVPATR
jgi:HEAT repeats